MTNSSTLAQKRYLATRLAAVVGALVNLILAAVKTTIGILSHSQALVADGIHSLSDLFSDALVYFAARQARHGPDDAHPYGHGRFETAATLALGGLLVAVAVGLIWEAAESLFSPEKLLVPDTLALYAAGFSIVANEALYHYTRLLGQRVKSDLLLANAWHHRSDSASSVVVLVGVAGTMAGLPYLDAVGAVAVGVMVVKTGWKLGWGAIHDLVDAGLDEERVKAIRETILSVGGVTDFHLLRTRKLGGHASADVHVQVEPWLSVSEGHMISLIVEERLKEQIEEIEDVTVHIDPEKDQEAILCRDLPLRSAAVAQLNQAWQQIDEGRLREWEILHYLSGKIDVDLFFSRKVLDSDEKIQSVERRLQEALKEIPEFGQVRIFTR